MSEDFASEFFGLEEFVITHIRIEKLKNANTRVYHWVERCGVLVPQFMALISARDLVVMNGLVRETLDESLLEGQLMN